MKQLLVWSVLLLVAATAFAADIYVVNSESRTLSHINTQTGAVNNVFCQLGLTPNRFAMDENYLYVVVSGDNAIQMISRSSGAHIRYIPVAASSNPWDCHKVGEFLYVSGLFTNKLYKISLSSYQVVGEIVTGSSPGGITSLGQKLYVANSGDYMAGYAGSSVAVIDLDSFELISTIPTWFNPQYLKAVNGNIHVACTGNWVDQFGKIQIIDAGSNQIVSSLDIGGSLGGMWYNGTNKVFVGDAMNSGIYSYDADSFIVYHNSSNPINPGGMTVSGDGEIIAILDASWGYSGKVKVLDHALTPVREYTVAMAPTDMQIFSVTTQNADELMPALSHKVYPNPAFSGSMISFELNSKTPSTISIYNLRGQQCISTIATSQIRIQTLDAKGNALAPGVYLYRIESGKNIYTGKLLLK